MVVHFLTGEADARRERGRRAGGRELGQQARAHGIESNDRRGRILDDARPGYVLSLAYLALFGSVVAFMAFLTLLKRIGAGRSGYTAAVIPLIAMLASTAFEGYRWSAAPVAGMLLDLGGTVLVLRAKERAVRDPGSFSD